MFERFTDRARRVVVLAQEEARLLNHNYIGTEHLLLGLLHEGEGVAAKALERIGISLDSVRTQVEELIGATASPPAAGHIPFTPRAKKVLELSLREALQLGHNYIGTEHILLGMIREGEGVAAQVLVKQGADLSRVRHEVISLLSGYGPKARSQAPEPGPPARYTPAAANALETARRLAAGKPPGTHHILRAILDDAASAAFGAIEAGGTDREALAARLDSADVTGTSDEPPDEAGARRTSIQLLGDKVAVVFDDVHLRERLASALKRQQRGLLVQASDPAARSFPRLWTSFNSVLGDVIWRLERQGSGEPSSGSDFRPPEWDAGWEVAAYAAVSGPALASHLELAEGADREAVRAGLAGWLMVNQPKGDAGQQPCNYLSIIVDGGDEPGGWGRVREMSTGVQGDWPRVALALLVAHAIVELSAEERPGQAPPAPRAAGGAAT